MTYEQLHQKRAKLGEAELARRREECRRRRGGHQWTATETNVPQLYCAHCLYDPEVDKE